MEYWLGCLQVAFWAQSDVNSDKPYSQGLFQQVTPTQAFALVVAAAALDVGHPGLNNAHLVRITPSLTPLYSIWARLGLPYLRRGV
jgi:hypothetical protein